jgi:hypothetical protein
MLNIFFIAAHGENFRRLPEFLAGPDVRITLICCSESMLRKSEFIDDVIEISQHPLCTNFIEDLILNSKLLADIDGWVTFASDDEMHQVVQSDLSTKLKLKLLPIRKAECLKVLGSKAEFISICTSADVPIPRSEIVEVPISLPASLRDFSSPFVIKSDQGSSGAGVRIILDESNLVDAPIPDSWFPLIIQEFIPGEPRGVDALFREGHLVAWMYCDNFQFPSEFGPSVRRRYVRPPSLDFEESLQRFAKATGAHGFANCSFFYLEDENRHVVFEIDMRTNAWHHYGDLFGLHWADLMARPLVEVIAKVHSPEYLPTEGVHLLHWQRFTEYAILNRDWKNLLRLLRMKKADRSPLTYRDSAINQAQILGLFRLGLLSLAKTIFEALPKNVQHRLKTGGITARFASRVTTR